MKSRKNAKSLPKRYFGLHMAEGVAEYADMDNLRIFINENTLKEMDPSYEGKPVYVHHVDEINLDTLEEDADGYVVRSFYNEADGKHWVEFLVTSDKGHEAIAKGWKLSNAYIPHSKKSGDLWHGVEYAEEITRGEYEHLAIVPDPRYSESIILTPEEFKQYNEDKKAELSRLSNSRKEAPKMALKIFTRKEADNAKELAGMSVLLPKSGKEITIEKLVNEADERESSGPYADPEHMVKMKDGSEMKLKDMMSRHEELSKAHDELKEKHEALEEEHNELVKEMDLSAGAEDVDSESVDEADRHDEDQRHAAEKKENKEESESEAEPEEESEEEKEKKAKDKKKNAKTAAEKLKEERLSAAREKARKLANAHKAAFQRDEEGELLVGADLVERGKQLYGSGK